MFWAVWGYCLVQRLGELGLAHLHWLGWKTRFERPPEPGYLLMVLLHTAFLIALPVQYWRDPAPGAAVWLGVFAFAQVLRYWLLWVMGRSWNTRIVAGSDYPICDRGPYRFIRHPNYLVVILEFLSLPMSFTMIHIAWVFSLLNGLVLIFRIRLEERYLYANPDWKKRMAHKPRFIPGIPFL
ncbi:MAG: hypothetical protein KDC71_13775 [Acidobacteria bacterium]|nr:hypothetical protein [Acidobacteriota bacterium]